LTLAAACQERARQRHSHNPSHSVHKKIHKRNSLAAS
jgi:hypothetical protein